MPKDVFKDFNFKNLRAGSRFQTGSNVPSSRGIGWSGALHDLKRVKRPIELENLTRKDIDVGGKVIEDALKHKVDAYDGLNRHDILKIHHTYEEMRRQGTLSKADIKDFENIADRLKKPPS
jgi:hypothetical protein